MISAGGYYTFDDYYRKYYFDFGALFLRALLSEGDSLVGARVLTMLTA